MKNMYIVPGMKLIPQQMNKSCWYACARMLINWRLERSQMSHQGLTSPQLDAECQRLRDVNAGIQNPAIMAMARRLGLKTVPPISVTGKRITKWLRAYGPLWVNGLTHITVIAGIYENPEYQNSHQILIYNPAPMNVGKTDWVNYGMWYEKGWDNKTRRDTTAGAEVTFLHCPAY